MQRGIFKGSIGGNQTKKISINSIDKDKSCLIAETFAGNSYCAATELLPDAVAITNADTRSTTQTFILSWQVIEFY